MEFYYVLSNGGPSQLWDLTPDCQAMGVQCPRRRKSEPVEKFTMSNSSKSLIMANCPQLLLYCFTILNSSDWSSVVSPASRRERRESTAVSEKRTKNSQNCLHFVPRLAVKVSAGCWSLAVLVLSLGVPVLGLGATVSISSLYLTVSPHSAASRGIPGVPGGQWEPAVQARDVFLYKYLISCPSFPLPVQGMTQVHQRDLSRCQVVRVSFVPVPA